MHLHNTKPQKIVLDVLHKLSGFPMFRHVPIPADISVIQIPLKKLGLQL